MEFEAISEKFKQIQEAMSELSRQADIYGNENAAFKVGDKVKFKRNGRKYIVISVQVIHSSFAFSNRFTIKAQYTIKPVAKINSYGDAKARIDEEDLELLP